MILTLLGVRAAGTTVCPSELARALLATPGRQGAAEDWRSTMPLVHTAIDRLLAEGMVRISWKGRKLKARGGPYRISRDTHYPPAI